jgi:hypothetical protein
MTEDRTPIDDELVSAVLDGEASDDERALVEGSPEGRRRLAELRAIAALVAAPPPELDPGRIDILVGRALDAAETPTPRAGADDLARRRAARTEAAGRWRRVLGFAAAAVVAVVVVGGLAVTLGGGRGESASDSASEVPTADQSGGSSSDLAGESTSSGANDTSSQPPVDLGPLPDGPAVLAAYAVLEGDDPDVAARTPLPAPEAAAPTIDGEGGCAVPPIEVRPGETWALVALAELPTGPVVVMADAAAGPRGRVLVVDAATCAVVTERSP